MNRPREEPEVLVRNVVVREKGWLYFVDQEGSVCRFRMRRTIK